MYPPHIPVDDPAIAYDTPYRLLLANLEYVLGHCVGTDMLGCAEPPVPPAVDQRLG